MNELENHQLSTDPFISFQTWYSKAKQTEANAEAMTLSTSDAKGRVNSRLILYKGIKDQCFSIYTNLGSTKAQELKENPFAALVFWWPSISSQIRLRGEVKVMDKKLSQEYFQSRAKLSQIASLTSKQSQAVESREVIEQKFKENTELYRESDVPFNPNHWGGFLLSPQEFEFFVYREHRLNDRFFYKKNEKNNSWDIQRLWP